MPSTPNTIFRLRVRDASDTSDALVVTSVRGGTNPYIAGVPTGDGTGVDDLTGVVTAASFTGTIVDPIIAGTSRLFTSLLEDSTQQAQLGDRRAAWEMSIDGGATWEALVNGYLTKHELTSDIEWSITVGDPTRVEHNVTIFQPRSATLVVGAGGAPMGVTTIPCTALPLGIPKGTTLIFSAAYAVVSADVAAGGVSIPATVYLAPIVAGEQALYKESIASFMARWPNRGCIFGGPVIGGFGPVQDRGGWEMTLQEQDGGESLLGFKAGYVPPKFTRTTRAKDCADPVNAKMKGSVVYAWQGFDQLSTFDQAAQGAWPGVVVEVIGHGYFQPSKGIGFSHLFGNYDLLVKPDTSRAGVFIQGTVLPVSSDVLRVRAFTAQASELSPIYWNGHPVDLIDLVEQEIGNTLDAAAKEATRQAIGADLQIALRITAPQNAGTFLEQAAYGPFGIGVRPNAAGALELFPTTPTANVPPAVTITNADCVKGTIRPYALDTSTAIRKVTFAHTRLVPNEVAVGEGYDGSGLDGFVTQDESFERTNGDPGAIGTGEQSYAVPGMVHTADSWTPDMHAWVDARVATIFNRRGRGLRTGKVTLLRGGAGDTLKLGDEALFALKQVPNHNKRLLDDNSVAARAMQIAHYTRLTIGAEVELIDSGPNAQPVATIPTLSIAAAADAPRTVAELTITNADVLNAAGIGVRVQRATTTGGAPAAGAYTDVAYFAPGGVPTTAIRLAPVTSGRSVYAQARSEQLGKRPSNYSAAVHVDLTAIAAPSALAASPDPADGSKAALTWTPGTSVNGIYTDVYVRKSTESASAATRRMTLLEASSQYTLEDLTPATSYIAGVQHRDASTKDVSALVEVAFTTSGAAVTLDPPTNPTGFSGTQDPALGFPQQDGLFGLAVEATEFPGFTEFVDEVETAKDSGIFGSPVTVGKIPNVQGDWTKWQAIAPNDGLAHQLSARQVRDGATPSAYTTGVLVRPWTSQPLGHFSEVAGSGDVLRVSSTESIDGKSREFKVVVGALVDSIHVHFRTVAIDVVGDPFDFSESADIPGVDAGSPMILRAPSDGSGVITFSIAHPLRGFRVAGRIIPYTAPPGLKVGASWPFDVDAAPPAVNAKLHPSRPTSTTADLSIDIAFAVSDGPVTVDVFEDGPSGTATILTKSMSAGATIDKVSDPALGGRALPSGKDSLSWRVRITDVAGQPWWFGPASANRDPLPNGHAVVTNYRANPVFTMDFDPDTDSIKVTTHSGKTKTWNAAQLAAAGSPVTYTVGDTLDDATTETALVVDETRSGYKVEYEGGSTWVQVGPGVTLHGQPSNPPTAKIELIPNSEASVESVKITPDTQVDEQLLVFYRQGDTDTTPQWRLCASAIDSSARSVVAGTVIGPADYFVQLDGAGNPTGSPQTILDSIALTRDQITRHGTMIQGKDSGIQSPWIPVVLSLLGQPWLESISAEFDVATHTLLVRVKGGAHCASVFIEASAAANFAAPLTASGACADGADVTFSFVLSAAQLGKTWYVGGTPFNQAALGGLMGVRQVAQVAVPAVFDITPTTSEASGQGTVTLVVSDPGSYFDPTWTNGSITTAISWEVIKLGVHTVEDCTTKPGVGTTGTYTKTITLDPLHPIQVNAYAHLLDGSTAPLGSWTFDSNKISDGKATAANNGVTATVTVTWDTDTRSGSNCARYSLDNGVTWTTVTVQTSTASGELQLFSQFNVTRTSSKQTALIQGQNALDGAWGNPTTQEIDAYLSEGPIYSVQLLANTPDASHDRIVWSCTQGTAQVSIDGGSFGTPAASPIDVAKPVTGRHTYVFQFTNGGVTVTDEVDVLPVSADTITPNLDVTLGSPTATTQPVTVSASNPVSGGTAPTITAKCVGCTMTIGVTTYPDGTTQTIASGTVVTGNRAATTTASMGQLELVATLGTATEKIVVPVPPQTQFGPIYSVQKQSNTPDNAHDTINWSCSLGTALLNINNAGYGTPAASPIVVSKPATIAIPYVFKFANGGITVTDEVDVLPVSADTVTPNLDVALGVPTPTTMPYTGTATNPLSGGSTPSITVKCVGCTMTISGTTYPDGTTQTIGSGTVVTGNKPASSSTTSGNLEFVATLGTATEKIVVPVPPQSPIGGVGSVQVLRNTPDSSHDRFTWSATRGTMTVSIDGAAYGTPSASPWDVSNTSTHTYDFKLTADDGSTQSWHFDVGTSTPAGGTSNLNGIFSGLTNAIHVYGNPGTVDFTWTASGFGAGVNVEVWVRDVGAYGDQKYHLAATGVSVTAGTYTYTAGESLSNTISPFVTIGFSLRAYSGSAYGTVSEAVETNYGSP